MPSSFSSQTTKYLEHIVRSRRHEWDDDRSSKSSGTVYSKAKPWRPKKLTGGAGGGGRGGNKGNGRNSGGGYEGGDWGDESDDDSFERKRKGDNNDDFSRSRMNTATKGNKISPPTYQMYNAPLAINTYGWGNHRNYVGDGNVPERDMTVSVSAFSELDLLQSFEYNLFHGITMYDSSEKQSLSEETLGQIYHLYRAMTKRDRGRGNEFTPKGSSTKPFLSASYSSSLLGGRGFGIRGGRTAVERALEKTLENLQVSNIDLYQFSKPSALYVGGVKAVMEGMARCKNSGLVSNIGLLDYTNPKDIQAVFEKMKEETGIKLQSNQFEFNILNSKAMEEGGTIDTCKKLGMIPFAHSPLGSGLASGFYTFSNPDGRLGRKPRYTYSDLEPYKKLHETLEEVSEKVTDRLNRIVTPTQVSLNWVRSKGVIPVVGCKNVNQAKDLLESLRWEINSAEELILDEVAKEYSTKKLKKLKN